MSALDTKQVVPSPRWATHKGPRAHSPAELLWSPLKRTNTAAITPSCPPFLLLLLSLPTFPPSLPSSRSTLCSSFLSLSLALSNSLLSFSIPPFSFLPLYIPLQFVAPLYLPHALPLAISGPFLQPPGALRQECEPAGLGLTLFSITWPQREWPSEAWGRAVTAQVPGDWRDKERWRAVFTRGAECSSEPLENLRPL